MRVVVYLAAMLVMALEAQSHDDFLDLGHVQVIGKKEWCSALELQEDSKYRVECIYSSKKECERISEYECKSFEDVMELLEKALK